MWLLNSPSKFVRIAYEHELDAWIKDGWLNPYPDQKLEPPRGLIPLTAIVQQNKSKVQPVMGNRELNQYIEAYTDDTDVCASKLRGWHQKGSDMSLLGPRRANLKVRVDESLWSFQTVVFHGKR